MRSEREIRHGAADLRAAVRRIGIGCVALGLLILTVVALMRTRTKHYDAILAEGAVFRATDVWGRPWTFTSQGESRIERDSGDVVSVALLPRRAGVRQPFLVSEMRRSITDDGRELFSSATEARRRELWQDIHARLARVDDGTATFRIRFEPLPAWGWVGGALLLVGGVMLGGTMDVTRRSRPARGVAPVGTTPPELDAAAERAIQYWRERAE